MCILLQAQFARSVVALKEIDGMWVFPHVLGLEVREVAAHHGDQLRGVLKGVDAHERWVMTCLDVTKGASFDRMGPLEEPPELCFGAVSE
jgi:hypothetical protein